MEKTRNSTEAPPLTRKGLSERPYHFTSQVFMSSYVVIYLIDYGQNLIGFIADILQVRFCPLGSATGYTRQATQIEFVHISRRTT